MKETREREKEDRKKEEQKLEFKTRQARLRAKARGDVEEEASEGTSIEGYIDAKFDVDNIDKNVRRRTALGEKRSRPVWSMTEGEAKSREEVQEVKEEEDLLSFVENLQDFEQFYDDMELKILMSQVKERVHVLEKEKHLEELRLQTIIDVRIQSISFYSCISSWLSYLTALFLQSENATVRSNEYNSSIISGMEELDRGDNISNNNARSVSDDDNDLRSIADTIQSNSDTTMGSIIHSRKSLNALVSRARDKYKSTSSSTKKALHTVEEGSSTNSSNAGSSSSSTINSIFDGEMNLAQPVKFVLKEDEGARLAETKSLNKLPFKCRNPAL